MISYGDLVATPLALQDAIKTAFGSEPDCLGIVVVKDLPAEYPALRERLLLLADRFAALDEAAREAYVDPRSHYRSVPPAHARFCAPASAYTTDDGALR